MSGIFSGAITAGLLATVAMVAADRDAETPSVAAMQAQWADQVFRLQMGGDAHSCTVQRGSVDMRGNAPLAVNSGCETLYPRFAEAQFWKEKADGTVAFTSEDGAVVIEFAVADGTAYQTFQPDDPLAALIALN